MAEGAGEKSFDATPHRRQEAREKGHVAFSQDLGSAALLLVGVLLLMMMGVGIIQFGASFMRQQLGEVTELVPSPETMVYDGVRTSLQIGMVLLPMLGLMMLGGVMSSVLQVGLMWVPERVSPDINRLNPLEGFKRIFSLTGTMRLGFGLLKVALVSIIAVTLVWMRWDEVMRSGSYEMDDLGLFLLDLSLDTVLWVAAALVFLAVLEYGAQRWKYEQDLRMTHQEVREEMKNMQGDPNIIARRRQIQRQMVMNRIGTSVPKADVIVTNPTELAVAIQYDPDEMNAPVVVAKGAGVLAQRIRKLGLENNIPIVERKPLARLLYKEVDVGRPVPTESYAAVAEVLAYVYQLKGKKVPAPPRAA